MLSNEVTTGSAARRGDHQQHRQLVPLAPPVAATLSELARAGWGSRIETAFADTRSWNEQHVDEVNANQDAQVQEVERINLNDGVALTALKFPRAEVVTLEVVHRPAGGPVQIGTGFSHRVVQIDDLAGTAAALLQRGPGYRLEPEPEQHPAGPNGPRPLPLHQALQSDFAGEPTQAIARGPSRPYPPGRPHVALVPKRFRSVWRAPKEGDHRARQPRSGGTEAARAWR